MTTNAGVDTDERSSSEPQAREGSIKRTKRKKASRACFQCQKAHLTCDDSRPCQRCIKRNLGGTCQDGVRKKAKYLQDVENDRIFALQQEREGKRDADAQVTTAGDTIPAMVDMSLPQGTVNLAAVFRPMSEHSNMPLIGDNLLFDYPPLSTYDFDSKAANLEYSMLSTMLGSTGTPGTEQLGSPDMFPMQSPSVNGLHRNAPSRQQTSTPDQNSVKSDSSWTNMPFAGAPAPTNVPPVHTSSLTYGGHAARQPQPTYTNGGSSSAPTTTTAAPVQKSPAQASTPGSTLAQVPPDQKVGPGASDRNNQSYTDPHGQRPTPVARRPFSAGRGDSSTVYKSVTKPFSYTNGYHLLNNYLRSRFEKQDLLRIARAIVGYRPSFIALTKTLREEDLTFMEVCFQRTMLEYEKFVGYSGTPTIIWRRTGQIELVGKEFCLLTQWSREQLLSKQTFIVELMDDSSVVEYFEKFSAHAFGDTSSVQTTCVLMTPQRKAVPCAFCFTIKRDVFDIPMMIVGNFLPVL